MNDSLTQPSSHRNLIIGGHNIEKGRYPYFVSIDKNNGVIVAGCLIAKDIVLSAGHVALDNMGNLTLKIGTYDVHADPPTFAEEIPVEKWLVPNGKHCKWDQFTPGYFANDYMIFKLAQPSTHNPIQLNRDDSVPEAGDFVRIMGLGWTRADVLSPSSIVKEIDMLTVSNEDCANTSDPLRGASYKGLIVDSMLCTISPPNTTRDACAWDSGAPVIVAGDSPEDDLLVGLGSTGVGCADAIFPSIQARVSAGYDWIEQQVCELSVDPPSDFDCSGYTVASKVDADLNATQSVETTPETGTATTTTAALYSKASFLETSRQQASFSSGSVTTFLATFSLVVLVMVGAVKLSRRHGRRYAGQNEEEHSILNVQLHRQAYDSMDC